MIIVYFHVSLIQLKKKPITIFKSGKQTRTFCYVTDAITAMFSYNEWTKICL